MFKIMDSLIKFEDFKNENGEVIVMASTHWSLPTYTLKVVEFKKGDISQKKERLLFPYMIDDNNVLYKSFYQRLCYRGNPLLMGHDNGSFPVCKHRACEIIRDTPLRELELHVKNISIDKEFKDAALANNPTPAVKNTRKRKAPEIEESPKEQSPINQTPNGVQLFQYFTNPHVTIKNHLFISNYDSFNKIATISANSIGVTEGLNIIETTFGCNINNPEIKSKTDTKYLFYSIILGLTNQRVGFQCACTGVLNGPLFTIKCDIVLNNDEQDYTLFKIKFKEWRNASFPLRNENEDIVRQFIKMCNGREIFIANFADAEFNTEEIKQETLKVATLRFGNGLLSEKFRFEVKHDWTAWIDQMEEYIESQELIERSNTDMQLGSLCDDATTFIKTSDLDQLKCSVETLKNRARQLSADRTFTFLVPTSQKTNASSILYALKVYYKSNEFLDHEIKSESFVFNKYEAEILTLDGMPYMHRTTKESEMSYLLIKPYGLRRENLKLIAGLFDSQVILHTNRAQNRLDDQIFKSLYSGNHKRPYGIEWKHYMMSGPVIHLLVETTSIDELRNKAIQIRQFSKLIWTRNIIHASSSLDEAKENVKMFREFFVPITTQESLKFRTIFTPINANPNVKSVEPDVPRLKLARKENYHTCNPFITLPLCRINGIEERKKIVSINWLIDTGANINIINKNTWAKFRDDDYVDDAAGIRDPKNISWYTDHMELMYDDEAPVLANNESSERFGYFRASFDTTIDAEDYRLRNYPPKNGGGEYYKKTTKVYVSQSDDGDNILSCGAAEALGLVLFDSTKQTIFD